MRGDTLRVALFCKFHLRFDLVRREQIVRIEPLNVITFGETERYISCGSSTLV